MKNYTLQYDNKENFNLNIDQPGKFVYKQSKINFPKNINMAKKLNGTKIRKGREQKKLSIKNSLRKKQMIKQKEKEREMKEQVNSIKQTKDNVVMKSYGESLFNSLKDSEKEFNFPLDFMSRHKITKSDRAVIIDWIIGILHEKHVETYFLSVFLFDYYLFKSQEIIRVADLYYLGITCIYIASKFNEGHVTISEIIEENGLNGWFKK